MTDKTRRNKKENRLLKTQLFKKLLLGGRSMYNESELKHV